MTPDRVDGGAVLVGLAAVGWSQNSSSISQTQQLNVFDRSLPFLRSANATC